MNRSSRFRARVECAALLHLAWPMIVAQILQVGMGFIDTVMVGRAGATDLAVVGIGSSLWTLVYLAMLGLMMAISPITANHFGAGRYGRIKDIFQQGIWLAIGVSATAFLITRHIWIVAHWMNVDAQVLPGLRRYLEVISWGMPAACLAMVPRFIGEGCGHTRPLMLVMLSLLPLDILGNYVFVFGHFGMPAMGATGAALATTIALWIGCAMMFGWINLSRNFPDIGFGSCFSRVRLNRVSELFRLGLPISVSMVFETSLFAAVAVLMGRLGTIPLAAHQIAINFVALTFMVPVGLTMAITIRVGHALGNNDADAARFRGWTGIAVAGLFMLCSGVFIFSFPEHIVSIYTLDPAVASMAVSLLAMAAMFQLFDGLQVAALGALRGYRDTRLPMIISLVSYWLCGFPISLLAAFYWDMGPRGLWLGLVCGLLLSSLLLNRRFHYLSSRSL